MDTRIIAIHECSHAIVCQVCDPRRIPVKVWIGENEVTGFTAYSSPNKVEITSENAAGRVATFLAGKLGEELIYGQEHGGSAPDIAQANKDCEEYGVLLEDGETLAIDVLTRNRALLEAMADDLVEKKVVKKQDLADWVKTAT